MSDERRLVVVSTSPRVAPGLLSQAAWDALRTAGAVLAAPGHPQEAALRAAGVTVTPLTPDDPEALARGLVERARRDDVVWLADPEDGSAVATALADLIVGGQGGDGPASTTLSAPTAPGASTAPTSVVLELVAGSYDLPGAHVLDLVEVMDRLRSPGGCPWDAQQTHESLLPYLVEEAYEVVDAVETGGSADLLEELGDLLLQVAFHARVAAERAPEDGGFTIDEVADGIVAKLIARHPHVFGDVEVTGGPAGAAEVALSWEALKAREKGRRGLAEGIPPQLPALAYAAKIVTRAAALGPPAPEAVSTVSAPDSVTEDTLGAALFGLVAAAVRAGVDPEGALRRRARTYVDAEQARPRLG